MSAYIHHDTILVRFSQATQLGGFGYEFDDYPTTFEIWSLHLSWQQSGSRYRIKNFTNVNALKRYVAKLRVGGWLDERDAAKIDLLIKQVLDHHNCRWHEVL